MSPAERYVEARQALAAVGMTPDPLGFPGRTLSGGYSWRYFRAGASYQLYSVTEAGKPSVELMVSHANAVDSERRANPMAFGGRVQP